MAEPHHLLLVDDSETVRGMLSYILDAAGYTTETAVDGLEALKATFRRVPDLILMATRMPRLDGIQACRLLKSEEATRDVPVILLSSQEMGPERMHTARAGADRCLLRDASPEEIVSSIGELLEGKSPRPVGSLVPGGAVPEDQDLLARINGVLEERLLEATLFNEISRVGREVEDFESTARLMHRVLRDIVPHGAMAAVFSDGVFSESVLVLPEGWDDRLRSTARELTEQLRAGAGVPFEPDRARWVEVHSGLRDASGPPAGLLQQAVCPVRSAEMVKGVLALYSGPETAAAPGDATETLLSHAFVVLENAWLYRQIQRMSVTDGLTGLSNVRRFREELQREHARARRHNDPYAVLMVDIDHFKKVNDVYGHPVGDAVLRELGAILREVVRATDLPARYGGEEFIVFLPQTKLPEAALAAERLRKAVERHVFSAPSPAIRCTVSVGAADYKPGGEGSEQDVVGRADQALYTAKREGRNRVVCDPMKET